MCLKDFSVFFNIQAQVMSVRSTWLWFCPKFENLLLSISVPGCLKCSSFEQRISPGKMGKHPYNLFCGNHFINIVFKMNIFMRLLSIIEIALIFEHEQFKIYAAAAEEERVPRRIVLQRRMLQANCQFLQFLLFLNHPSYNLVTVE